MIKDFDKNVKKYRDTCFKFTAKHLIESVNDDNFIVQSISQINELDKTTNLLSRRLHEYSGLYLPELYDRINDNETFSRLLTTKTKSELMSDLKLEKSIGADLSMNDLEPLLDLAKHLTSLFLLRKKTENYLTSLLIKHMPNTLDLLGTMITSKMISIAGSLKHLALFPASTIQMLGAETALFRHLKSGARCPKYGFLFMHPMLAQAKPKHRGKIARMLADKVSIASRIDYFKGEFKADVLKKELEEKISKLN